jgi:hypothetical protein
MDARRDRPANRLATPIAWRLADTQGRPRSSFSAKLTQFNSGIPVCLILKFNRSNPRRLLVFRLRPLAAARMRIGNLKRFLVRCKIRPFSGKPGEVSQRVCARRSHRPTHALTPSYADCCPANTASIASSLTSGYRCRFRQPCARDVVDDPPDRAGSRVESGGVGVIAWGIERKWPGN